MPRPVLRPRSSPRPRLSPCQSARPHPRVRVRLAGALLLAAAATLAGLLPASGLARMRPAARVPDLPDVARGVVERSNAFRHENGLAPVATNERLTAAAAAFAAHLARTDHFSHEADGREPADRALAQGYTYCMVAENIALEGSSEGFATSELAEHFVEGWIHSPGHRRNLLAADATETGVAIAYGPRSDRYYAVQMLGRPESMRVRFEVVNRSRETVSYRIGDESFPLPPGVRRTHALCGPEQMVMQLRPQGSQPLQLRPVNGAHYRVETVGPALRLLGG